MITPTNKKIMMNVVTSSVVAGLATKMLFGEVETVSAFGMNMPSYVAVGSAVGVGSAVSDLSSEYVIRRLGMTNQFVNGSTMALQAGLCGAAASTVLYFGAGLPSKNLVNSFILGSSSKLMGDYAETKLFDAREGIIGPIF